MTAGAENDSKKFVLQNIQSSTQSDAAESEQLSDDAQKKILNRLSRVTGHLGAIRRMVEERREIESILIQLSAVKSAVNGAGRELLSELIRIRSMERTSDLTSEEINEIVKLVNRYLK